METQAATHTPGPWRFEWSPESMEWCIDADNHIARVRTFGIPERRDEANARLSAAAPDLLAAAKNLLAELDRWEVPQEDENGNYAAAEDALRAAIAKAEGR